MAGEASLHGFVEKISHGDGFIVLSGWATTAAAQDIDSLLTLRIDGEPDLAISQLTFRKDLVREGVSDGMAGFEHSMRTNRNRSDAPQVFASTPHVSEIVISGPGTIYTAFVPVGAFDNISEDGISGWIFDPSQAIAGEETFIGVDKSIKIRISQWYERKDLPFDAGRDRLLGFTIPFDEIAEAFSNARVDPAGKLHLFNLMSSGQSVAEASFVWPGVERAVEPGTEVPVVSDVEQAAAIEASPSLKLMVRVEKVHLGREQSALTGWLAYSDKSAIEQPLVFELDGCDQTVVVPELDVRADIAKKGIAGGRASFSIVFPRAEHDNPPSALVVRTADGTLSERLTLTPDRLTGDPILTKMRTRGFEIRGFFLDLDSAKPASTIDLLIDKAYMVSLTTEALDLGERFWAPTGQAATGFRIHSRDILAKLRGQNPLRTFPTNQKIPIALLANGAVHTSIDVSLVDKGKGRLEVVNTGVVSGWLVSGREEELADFDVFVNGVRYMTGRADRSRSDLVAKGLATSGGGFRFEPANPDIHSSTVAIEVKQAFTDIGVGASEAPLDLPSSDYSNLDRLYSVLTSVKRRKICIIVPIYNAASDLKLCIESLVRNTDQIGRLLLIDDCSPDPTISEILEQYKDYPNITILKNEVNLGFTKTVNRGISEAGEDDVVFLNSDTIVTPGWLQGLRLAAYSGPNIATATALSNNSGVFSVPEINVDNIFPAGFDVDDFSRLVRQASISSYPRVPTGNGFCMFVRRDAIDAIGPLDQVAFPVGYGEENDFCMRAVRAGFEHVCDDRTFVYHKRSASFGNSKSDHYANGRNKLKERYPEYSKLTTIFDRGSPMLAMRWRVRKAVFDQGSSTRKPLPRVAFVIATQTGGTPQTNRDLMSALSDRYESWVLRCDSRQIEVYVFDGTAERLVHTHRLRNRIVPTSHRSSEYNEEMTKLLVLYGFELVHIRHLAWHGTDLPAVCKELGLPVILSFHDFYTVCPTVKLLDENRVFCAGKCTDTGGDCAVELWEPSLFPVLKHQFIHRWRDIFGEAFAQCSAFVTTSERARAVFVDNFPTHLNRDFHVIPHGRSFAESSIAFAFPELTKPMRVLVPGNISPAKGADLIREILDLDVHREVEFHILGDAGRLKARDGLIIHGLYKRDDFSRLVQGIKPNVGAVLSIWPETYCHTLTEMWSSGIPVVGIDVGAVGERIQKHGGGWLAPLGSTAAELFELLRNIKNSRTEMTDKVSEVFTWQNGYGRSYNTAYMALKYDHLYRNARREQLSFMRPDSDQTLREVAVVGGQTGSEANLFLDKLTKNKFGSEAVFWHIGRDWSLLQESSVSVDALLVVPDQLLRGDGQRLVSMASQRNLPFHVLIATKPVQDEGLSSQDGLAEEGDRAILSNASSVMVLNADSYEWALRYTPHVVMVNDAHRLNFEPPLSK